MPLCALSEFSRGFMMATMMSGLFICGQTDHSNTEIQISPGAGTECAQRITSESSASDMHKRQWKQRRANGSKRMMIGEKGKHPPPPTPITPPDCLTQSRPSSTGQKATGTTLHAGRE